VPEVFINYRTGDGDEAAALVDSGLSLRFGADKIFFASRSIPPGTRFPVTLISEVLQSRLVLAIMGPDWSHDQRLHHEDDWVRREIMAARGSGILVIPVLKGRGTPRLDASDLPGELEWLAEVQSLRLDPKDYEASISRIGDELADQVPALRAIDQARAESTVSGNSQNTASDVSGSVVQGRDISGDATVTTVTGGRDAMHAGNGDIYTRITFRGGTTGGVRFGSSHHDKDDR
jgi:hypothetical protein